MEGTKMVKTYLPVAKYEDYCSGRVYIFEEHCDGYDEYGWPFIVRPEMEESDDGEYVLLEDYNKLLSQYKRLGWRMNKLVSGRN
jgi:hypothetical protein